MATPRSAWVRRLWGFLLLASAWLVAADVVSAGGIAATAGRNKYGQLALNDNADRNRFYAVTAPTDIVAASCGFTHSLVAIRDGYMASAGLNKDGQLGLGHNTDKNVFQVVSNMTNVVAVAGGGGHSLAVTSDGSCYSTGRNSSGQLGQGNTAPLNTFTKVTGLPPLNIYSPTPVAAGENHSLALGANGRVYACGANGRGQLGIGWVPDQSAFVQVPGLALIVEIACGANHSMARDIFGFLYTWGANDQGQLGIGGTDDVPVRVFCETGVIMLAGGGLHSLIEKADGSLYSTGDNTYGQLGLGDNDDRLVFTKVPTISNLVSIAAGYLHSLVAADDTSIWSAGFNAYGQLGLGIPADQNTFVKNSDILGVGLVRCGEHDSLVVTELTNTVQFPTSAVQVTEATAGTVQVTVTLTPPSYKTVTVDYKLTGGTATLGKDFTFTGGTLTFLPGEYIKTLTYTVTDDSLDENDETLEISLVNPINVALGNTPIYSSTILDDDPMPTIAFSAATSSTPENVAFPDVVKVQLSAVSGRQVDVTCKATGGTAGYNVDWRLTGTLITIPPGDTEAVVPVNILDDKLQEVTETALMALSVPKNATLGAISTHTLSIVDDELPTLQFDKVASSVSESTSKATIKVTLSRVFTDTVTVDYAATGGTATGGGVDYTLAAGTLTFNPGDTSKTFDVAIVNDGLPEPDETAIIALSNPAKATVGTPGTHTLTLLDNSAPVMEVTSSGVLNFGNVPVGDEKIIPDAYAIKNTGGSTLHVKIIVDDPPFHVLDAKGLPYYELDVSVPSGQEKKIPFSCVPYTLGTFSRTLFFNSDGGSTTRTAKCVGDVEFKITSCPSSVTRGKTISVVWTVAGGKPTHNGIHWGISKTSLPNATSNDLLEPYKGSFTAPSKACTVYLQAHAIVYGKSFYSTVTKVTVK